MSTPTRAGGSAPPGTRARSFDVRVTRVHFGEPDGPGSYSGEVVFHAFPVSERHAQWLNTILPRINSQGHRYHVAITELDS